MKKLHYILSLLLVCAVSQAGLITHSDYTSGTAVTAAGQNTNENLIFNEFNGNIDNTNIKTGGITTANILNANVTAVKLESPITLSSATITNLTATTLTVTNTIGSIGKIKQVAFTQIATQASTTGSSYGATNLAITFTNLNAGCTVYIFATGDAEINSNTASGFFTIERDTTDLSPGGVGLVSFLTTSGKRVPISMIAKDTLSAVGSYAYKVWMKNNDGTSTLLFPSNNATTASIFLIEVF